ncbi:S8 family peptidase [Arcticibacterium luteifluviistationis]|uniref:Peptidase S8 n=1 Tax=Arcticibacterium luteifluviistationis TaxID=1784714 RepID=A0A2Z4G9S6_9BACT|nr:S8 family peptidase [Arcticibacterium luteifluviistationis]AWV97967.1 peptidase S8 [Arcticibacterium luteifluviistationis]
MKKSILASLCICLSLGAFAQELKTKANWFNLDYEKDGVRGMSVEKAYDELLKGRISKTVIVGVVDSGVDIEHEDLKGKIWVNENEIPNNGKDDDNNGFVDDINGWDFIGGADGTDVEQEQLESARLYVKYSELFGENPKKRLLRKYKEEYNTFQKIKKEIDESKKEAEQYLPMYETMKENLSITEQILGDVLGSETFSREQVQAIDDSKVDLRVRQSKQYWLRMEEMGAGSVELQEGIDHFKEQLNFNYNTEFNPRAVVGDNPDKLEYGKYGNNEVKGPRALHGTHVSGIIAANRDNDLGVKGVANDVKIMVVRTVPGGDERDKDVANAIRYAVDNGAKIINMSFGKPYSPEKGWVDDAIKYAESKDVLLISAAGNDNANVDVVTHYPTKYYKSGGEAKNWIGVGASSYEDGLKMVADFSNYGKKSVDVFAPGVAIYSTEPGSKYGEKQGTSMAAPAVTGVAALLKSYFPTLTAVQLKEIILQSSIKLKDEEVILPGGEKEGRFGSLSGTGGVVNAYEAVKMAIQMTAEQ